MICRLSYAMFFRNKRRIILMFVIIMCVTFTLFSQVFEHTVTMREIEKAAEQYNGIGAIEVTKANSGIFGAYFTELPTYILHDQRVDTSNVSKDSIWQAPHYEAITKEYIDSMCSLPYVSEVDLRYMTAGISDEYKRIDDRDYFYNYADQCIVEGKLEYAAVSKVEDIVTNRLTFSNVKVISGYPDYIDPTTNFYVKTWRAEGGSGGGSANRCYFFTTSDYPYTVDFCQTLEIGNTYAFVLRYDNIDGINVTNMLGDFLIETWSNTFWDVTDVPENYIDTEEYADMKQVAEMIELNYHSFDVVYTDNISSIMRFANGNMEIIEGRGIEKTDSSTNPNVCVISRQLAAEYGLEVGDTLNMKLGDKLFEQYKGLGAVPVVPGRVADSYTEVTLEIVGIYIDIDANRQQAEEPNWSYSINTIFVPQALLNVSDEELANHTFAPGEVSFVIEDAWDIAAFSEECIPKLEELGLTVLFEDQGWLEMEEGFAATEKLGVIKILVLLMAVLVAVWFVAMLYITGRRKDYAIMRVLGTSVRKASFSMLLPFMVLVVIAVIFSLSGAWINTQRTIAENNAAVVLEEFGVDISIPFWIIAVCAVSAIVTAFLVAYLMLANLGKKAPLVLLQNSDVKHKKKKDKKETTEEPQEVHITEQKIKLLDDMKKNSKYSRRFVWKYTFRHIKRASAKSILTVLLCVLLLNVVGQLDIMIGSYERLVEDTVVTSNYVGGLPLLKIRELSNSEYVDDVYYVRSLNMDFNYSANNFVVTNNVERYTGYTLEIKYAKGYDKNDLGVLGNGVVISQNMADTYGVRLGDSVVIGPEGYMKSVQDGHIERHRAQFPEDTITDGEILALYAEDIADIYKKSSYECTIIAVFSISDEEYDGMFDDVVFSPGIGAYEPDIGTLAPLDIAEATVADNNLVDEYREFGQELAGGSVTEGVMFVMDTSKLENLRNTLRLVEMLYPIAVVVTLVISAFLCGLIIVQTSKDIAIMRVLGTSKAKTRTVLVLEQMVLCVIGIIIAGIVLYIRGALMQMLWVFGVYVLVILAASSVASVAASRKNVLELLQTKE